jgi:hypothetical protein
MKTNTGAILVPPPRSTSATNPALATDIHDIRGPIRIASGWIWLWLALGVVAAATAVLLALRRWRTRMVQRKAMTIIVPPEVRARNGLRAALEKIGMPPVFCILVSDTLRVYLEERFAFHAPDRTTEEFLDELQSSPMLSLSQKRSLGDFLTQCDLVKFARYEPGEPELHGLYESALRLVDETASGPAQVTPEIPGPPPLPPVSAGREHSAKT